MMGRHAFDLDFMDVEFANTNTPEQVEVVDTSGGAGEVFGGGENVEGGSAS
jgi:hypothetical protein